MKRFLLLLLLSSWAHLGIEGKRCGTSVVNPGHLLSVERSTLAGADVIFLKSYHTSDLHQCLKECCFAKRGVCSVAAFKNKSETPNCFHYSCQPLSKCKYRPFGSMDSYAFPVTHRDDMDASISTPSEFFTFPSPTESTTMSTTSDPSSKISDNLETTTNSSLVENVTLGNDMTTQPPKMPGSHENVTETQSNVSNIKPRKGVDLNFPIVFNSTNSSKIKARKGVEPFLPHIIQTTPTLSSSRQETSDSSNLISMLEEVFQDELNTTEYSLNSVENITKMVESSINTVKNKPLVTSTETGLFQVRSSSTPTIHSTSSSIFYQSVTTVPVQTQYPQSTQLPIKAELFSSTTSTESYINNTTHQNQNSKIITESSTTNRVQYETSSEMIPLVSISSSQTNTNVTFATKVPFVYEVITNSTMFSEMPIQLLGPKSHEDEVSEDNAKRYKSSMHIVLALVFGLLIVFVVIGAIAKRIHDVWLRRHYHRMDFLIDGMYDGYS